MENTKKLTVWESACIITGYGVGGGVLSMPYMAERNGFLTALLILIAALIASYVLHLMIADLALKTEGGQIVSCMSKYLFRGKWKTVITIFFTSLMNMLPASCVCCNFKLFICTPNKSACTSSHSHRRRCSQSCSLISCMAVMNW